MLILNFSVLWNKKNKLINDSINESKHLNFDNRGYQGKAGEKLV